MPTIRVMSKIYTTYVYMQKIYLAFIIVGRYPFVAKHSNGIVLWRDSVFGSIRVRYVITENGT